MTECDMLFHSVLDAGAIRGAESYEERYDVFRKGGGSRIETKETLDVVELIESVSRS